MTDSAKLLGAVIAVADNLLVIALLTARLGGRPRLEYGLGLVLIGSAIPLLYLLLSALRGSEPTIYIVWVGLMIVYLVAELLLDYIFKYDFRHTLWMAIAYVMLFFSATGGMIGAASRAGRLWSSLAGLTWLIMAGLTFYQRWKTGL